MYRQASLKGMRKLCKGVAPWQRQMGLAREGSEGGSEQRPPGTREVKENRILSFTNNQKKVGESRRHVVPNAGKW